MGAAMLDGAMCDRLPLYCTLVTERCFALIQPGPDR